MNPIEHDAAAHRLKSLAALSVLLALTACGGDDGSDASTTPGGSPTATAPTTADAAATCAGTPTSTTRYDVFLNTAAGIDPSLAARTATRYGADGASRQCLSIAASGAQADPAVVQAVTNDGWDNAIAYFDPTGASTGGGDRFGEQLLVTCAGNQLFKHVAIANPASAPTLATSGQVAALAGKTLVSYTCPQSSGGAALDTGSTAVFGTDGTVRVDGSDAYPVASLFSPSGYVLGTRLIHWHLYQVTVGSTVKQVVVHTRYDASNSTPYNIDVFTTND